MVKLFFQISKFITLSIFLEHFLISAKTCEDSTAKIERIKEGITKWSKLDCLYYKPMNFNPGDYNYTQAYQDAEHYDFIVIGSGASGAIVASRLSQVPEWKVLLLEAGPEENELVDIPGTYPYLRYTQYDWGFESVPQEHTCGDSSIRSCPPRAGKGLGGGTLVNGFQYNHGTPGDYDYWASLGFRDWSWRNVFPFLIKPERANHIEYIDWAYHGRTGPLYIEDFRFHSRLSRYILDGGKELGFQVADYNGKNQTVYSLQYGTTHDGSRFTSAHAYLRRDRPNLTIKTESYALKIIMDEGGKVAKGVEYLQLKDNQLKVAIATKEVIVSGGAIKTPQILMLSGIGPREHLESKNVTTLVDLPVGSNFNNHLSYWGFSYSFDAELFENYTLIEQIQEYVLRQEGELTNMGLDGVAYYMSDIHRNFTGPNIEFQFSIRQPGISDSWSTSNQTTLVIEINIMHPFSKGNVSLNDSDPLHDPLIDPNYYAAPEDVDMVIEGIHRALEFMNTTTMRSLGPNMILKYTDECGDLTRGDDFWRCSIKRSTSTLSHYCGSASMGLVVDERLKVYGVNNLRVIDGSILPVTISGHLMSPCNMIGEKGAAIIRSDWAQSPT